MGPGIDAVQAQYLAKVDSYYLVRGPAAEAGLQQFQYRLALVETMFGGSPVSTAQLSQEDKQLALTFQRFPCKTADGYFRVFKKQGMKPMPFLYPLGAIIEKVCVALPPEGDALGHLAFYMPYSRGYRKGK